MNPLYETYYVVGYEIYLPLGNKTEWRIYRYGYDEDLWYINYNKGVGVTDPNTVPWIWYIWYKATREERQEFFKVKRPIYMKKIGFANSQPEVSPVVTCPTIDWDEYSYYSDGSRKDYQEKGNNPMFTECKKSIPCGHANVSGSSIDIVFPVEKSDEMLQREYLLGELKEMIRYQWADSNCWYGQTLEKLQKQFNLDAPLIPQSSQAILDAFKNGAFTVDQTKIDKNAAYWAKQANSDRYDDNDDFIGDRYYGITFTGLPVEDRKGYDAARTALDKLIETTRRQLMIVSPTDGLAALTALETWTYTPPAAAS